VEGNEGGWLYYIGGDSKFCKNSKGLRAYDLPYHLFFLLL
jgi:hypothetical protein